MPYYARYFSVLLVVLCLLLIMPPNTTQAIIQIPVNSPAFIQTSGPNANLGVGDYLTNVAGDNGAHSIGIHIPCVANLNYRFELFDPAIDIVFNPPGVGIDGVSARVRDEPRDAGNNSSTLVTDFDNTTFEVLSPNNTSLITQVYTPNTSDGDWTLLYTLTLPPAPTHGIDCGLYTVRSNTADNDDNSWRFRLDGDTFQPELGPDNIGGTGDEAAISLKNISYQHLQGVCPGNAQDFFWFSGDGNSNMYMVNFDLDNNATVTYHSPSGDVITGTVSGQTVWNNSAPQQVNRPTFANMDLFDPISADFVGDAIVNPESGLWRASICLSDDNQYSFEVPGQSLFLEAPEIPNVVINKDDGVTVVNSPDTTTYTLTITNTSNGAALSIPGPEVVDTLPAGMSFISCTVNAPLVGSCSNVGNTVNVELLPQVGIHAYLPASGLPNDSGTITIVAGIDAGLADGTTLLNTASVDWTGIFDNDYEPNVDTDIDTVVFVAIPPTATPPPTSVPPTITPDDPPITGEPNDPDNPFPPTTTTTTTSIVSLVDPYITKSVNPPFSLPGVSATWTITIFNPTDTPINNLIMQDSLPPQVEIVSTSATTGAVSFSGQTVNFIQAIFDANSSVTITVVTRVRPNVAPPPLISNRACFNTREHPEWECDTASIFSITGLPSTGQSPWSPYRPFIIALLGLSVLVSGGYISKRLLAR